jgi:hypothetical protein
VVTRRSTDVDAEEVLDKAGRHLILDDRQDNRRVPQETEQDRPDQLVVAACQHALPSRLDFRRSQVVIGDDFTQLRAYFAEARESVPPERHPADPEI